MNTAAVPDLSLAASIPLIIISSVDGFIECPEAGGTCGPTKYLEVGEQSARATGEETRMLASADGTQIYANAVGNPSKRAIVFIHGFVWNSMAFDDIFCDPDWTSHLYLVRYDARGHGRSGKPDTDEGWASERFAEDFKTVSEAFKLQKPFIAGWSLGASHLVDILSFHPVDSVLGIINIAGCTYIDDTLLDRLATPAACEWIRRITTSPDVDDFQAGAAGFIDGCCRTLSYGVRQACLGNVMTQPRYAMLKSLTRKQNIETFGNVGRTMLPCLVIYGDQDELVTVHKLPGCYKDWKNVTVEVIEGGSHVPWSRTVERTAAHFKEKTLRWVDSVAEPRL